MEAVVAALRRRAPPARDRAGAKTVSDRICGRLARPFARVERCRRRMVGRMALRRRWPGKSGSPCRVHAVLVAGGPARDALHLYAARNRRDDAHRQTVMERRTNTPDVRHT